MTWLRLALIAAVVGLATAGMLAIRAHFVGQGRTEVQQRWDAQAAADRAAAAEHTSELERLARRDGARKQQEAERIAREQQALIADLSSRARRADARSRQLRDTITALNARDRALSGAGADARAAGGADGAAIVARELLGRCSERYTAVAADAGRYAAQVIGLQKYATMCQAVNVETGAQE